MLVVNRFRIAPQEQDAFRPALEDARAALADCPGFVSGTVGRNVDEPTLWVLTTTWAGPGAYRRALSSYDVKLRAVPVLGRALDEPGAYEIVEPGAALNEARARSLG